MHGGYELIKRNGEGRRLLEFCDENDLCMANTWFEKKEQRKIAYHIGGNETQTDFVLVGTNNRKYLKTRKPSPESCNIG